MKTYEDRIEIYKDVIPEFRFMVFVKYEGGYILSGKKIRERLAPRHKSQLTAKDIICDLRRFREENSPNVEDVKKFFGVAEAFIEKADSINDISAIARATKQLKQQAELRMVYFSDGSGSSSGRQYRLMLPKSSRIF